MVKSEKEGGSIKLKKDYEKDENNERYERVS